MPKKTAKATAAVPAVAEEGSANCDNIGLFLDQVDVDLDECEVMITRTMNTTRAKLSRSRLAELKIRSIEIEIKDLTYKLEIEGGLMEDPSRYSSD